MMSVMRVKKVLPYLLAMPLLAMIAVLVYQAPPPAAAQGEGPLPAPTLNLAAAANCNPKNPRTYLFAHYTAVEGADRYEHRVKWGRGDSFGRWKATSRAPGGRHWPVFANRFIRPGESYVVQMRAFDEDGNAGAVGSSSYSYRVGDVAAPGNVAVAYATDEDDEVDYTRARLTWQGDAGSSGWFSVQQRSSGGKWRSEGWKQAARVDADEESSAYYRDFTGLDVAKGYEFRVTGHTPQCEASPWSVIAALEQAPDPPTFGTSVGMTADGPMLGVWITDPQESADHHVFQLDAEAAVRMAMPVMQHRFPVKAGQTHNVCVMAGNTRGNSGATCRPIVAKPEPPFASLELEPSDQLPGTLDLFWTLVPVVNPTWYDDDPGSTHTKPAYRVAIREVSVAPDIWPDENTEFRIVYQEGQQGGVVFDGLKGNTRYEVAIRSEYYGESEYAYAVARTNMSPVRDLVVGFDDEVEGRAVVTWQAPADGNQTGYTVMLRETHNNERVFLRRPKADATQLALDGLEQGRWYHVNVRAVGEDNRRSAVTTCYFRQGSEGSQNRAGAYTGVAGSSCAAE